MKSILILLSGLAASLAAAQPTNTPPQEAQPPFPGHVTLSSSGTSPYFKETKVNEIVSGKITLSGSAIEAAKIHNPLQLINPAAPPEYGYAYDNVVRDPITGRASGLKIFAIQF